MNYKDLIGVFGMFPHPEGGYFVEIHRSGSIPMSTKGQSDYNVPSSININDEKGIVISKTDSKNEALTIAPKTKGRRPDGDIRRNYMTSIMWMSTIDSPKLTLAINLSEIVHFYHGGNAFHYIIYDPVKNHLYSEILGPDILNGHKVQAVVNGGLWKCGFMIKSDKFDHSLIGEAVSPGFDFHDFSLVTKTEVASVPNEEHRNLLLEYVHQEACKLSENMVQHAESFYDHSKTNGI